MNLVTETDDNQIVTYLTEVISNRLAEEISVLWLVPGGSAMEPATKVLQNLEDVDTSLLCITLTDERYGRPDHEHENWAQLARLGFTVNSINAYRVLRGETIETTAQDFSDKLQQLYATYEYKIGLFGIGTDGHTAGIKPHSIAATDEDLAVYYTGEDYERVTMTPHAIRKLDEVVAYAHGEEKFSTIQKLLHENIPVEEQPAQCLKWVEHATLFSDYSE